MVRVWFEVGLGTLLYYGCFPVKLHYPICSIIRKGMYSTGTQLVLVYRHGTVPVSVFKMVSLPYS